MWKNGNGDAGEKRGNGSRTLLEGDPSESASGKGADVIAFVGKGVEFKGVIRYDGTVRIDGQLEGEIHTTGVLLVGEEAILTASVNARKVVSQGQITGDIIATESVQLLAPAVLKGSIKAPLLSMEQGVVFSGTLDMSQAESQPARPQAIESVAPIRSGPFTRPLSG
ncbi:MAG: polymer-forming cytoskeletal protein [Nitrospirota bacterium]